MNPGSEMGQPHECGTAHAVIVLNLFDGHKPPFIYPYVFLERPGVLERFIERFIERFVSVLCYGVCTDPANPP